MSNQLVTVAAFIFPFDAYLMKLRLESEGVECYFADEITGAFVNWLWCLAIGGIKIKVKESDVELVAEILSREPEITDLPEEWAFEDGTVRTCPRCNSPVVFYEIFDRRIAFISIMVLGFPIPVPAWKWECLRCRKRWRR
jgi:hypothetical protein